MPQEIINKTTESDLEILQDWLTNKLAETLSISPDSIDSNVSLTRYGLDSIDAVTVVGDIEEILEVELPSTLFWDYPTIESAARYLREEVDFDSLIVVEIMSD